MSEWHTSPDLLKEVEEIDESGFSRTDYNVYFKCDWLQQRGIVQQDLPNALGPKKFSLKQLELELIQAAEDEETGQVTTQFAAVDMKYDCEFIKSQNFNKDKPTALICIKENVALLDYTLDNLEKHEVSDQCNILIIEDRPDGNCKDIYNTAASRGYSYVSVNYEGAFNFSMLNNIGAGICDALDNREIILWNSDLWAHDTETLPKLLNLHRENNAEISGAKLVYPEVDWKARQKGHRTQVEQLWGDTKGAHLGTVQHAGIYFAFGDNLMKGPAYHPIHERRFAPLDNPIVNSDKGTLAVTGAFQIIKLSWFVGDGGFNPSLKGCYQDVDLCLRSDRVFYFGKDKFLYHGESECLISSKEEDAQETTDAYFHASIIFYKIYNFDLFVKNILNKYTEIVKETDAPAHSAP